MTIFYEGYFIIKLSLKELIVKLTKVGSIILKF